MELADRAVGHMLARPGPVAKKVVLNALEFYFPIVSVWYYPPYAEEGRYGYPPRQPASNSAMLRHSP